MSPRTSRAPSASTPARTYASSASASARSRRSRRRAAGCGWSWSTRPAARSPPTPRPRSSTPRSSATVTYSCCRCTASGPAMRDGAVIPQSRTAVPVELDRIFDSLHTTAEALGPAGANKDGSLSRLLGVSADNLDGQGKQLQPDGRGPVAGGHHPVRRQAGPVRHRTEPAGVHRGAGRRRQQRAVVQRQPRQGGRPARGRTQGPRGGAAESGDRRSATCPASCTTTRSR